MTSSLWFLYIAGALLGILGISLLVASVLPAWRRGQPILSAFLVPREMLLGRELVHNRVGFLLSVVGIVMAASVVFQLRG